MVYRGLHSKVLNMSMIGYARVSTDKSKQLLDRQLDALNLAGCERIFEDHSSGSDPDRPGLISCIDYIRSDGVLIVLDLDRLGRLARELLELSNEA
jgi:DNA invertase Pin-like site-specific DNA recombinase